MGIAEWQCHELRRLSDKLGNEKEVSVTFVRVLVIPIMREAADTIERLRGRLQESYGKVPELGERENSGEQESYDAGFSNGVKACLQQLDGLIHEGANVDEIQGWIDRQLEEET